LLGAYIADAHWGRFKTICWAVFIALIGHIILAVSAVPGVIEKESAIAPFIISLIVMGLGWWLLFDFGQS
jgi:POT family proton-dependent oligopeptide transporter